MKITTRSWKAFGFFSLLFSLLVLSGCADALVDGGAPAEETLEASASLKKNKFRHTHLMDQALKQVAGKSMSGGQLNLIVKLADGVIDKQRVLERYRVLDRFRVLERYEYNTVFNGWAWEITDESGQNDYYALLSELMQDDDILWFEPDFDVTTPEANTASGGSGQMLPWSVAAIGGEQSWAESGNGEGSVNVDIYVLDTGVAQASNNDSNDDLRLTENIDLGFNRSSQRWLCLPAAGTPPAPQPVFSSPAFCAAEH